MTDHAKALRYIAAIVESPPRAAAICYEAADEIDRLRNMAIAFAEALDLALDGEQDHDIDPGPTGMTQEQCDHVIAARSLARAFLAGGK